MGRYSLQNDHDSTPTPIDPNDGLFEAIQEKHEVHAPDEEVSHGLVLDDGAQHEEDHEGGEPGDDQGVHPDWVPSPRRHAAVCAPPAHRAVCQSSCGMRYTSQFVSLLGGRRLMN